MRTMRTMVVCFNHVIKIMWRDYVMIFTRHVMIFMRRVMIFIGREMIS